MSSVIATIPRFQFSSSTGMPLANGTLTVYLAGTTTPTNTWQDQAQSTLNTNPVQLDSRGECVLWLDPAVQYKFILKNSGGAIQWTQDNISGADSGLRGALAASGGSSLVGFIQSGTGAVARTVQDKARESVSVLDFGAVGDGVTDDTAALVFAKLASDAGTMVTFPKGTYLTSAPITFTIEPNWIGSKGTRIKLTASASYVIYVNGTGGNIYGAVLENFIIDGGGFAADGLLLKNVISSKFNNILCTNVTASGLHLAWAQLCTFDNYVCSRNVEAFTTTPYYGIRVDGIASSSANTFINPTIEHVGGSGMLLLSLINSNFIGGTSEGNNVGIELGETVATLGTVCQGNTFTGIDLEANTTADIILRATASSNTFPTLTAGYGSPSPSIQLIGSKFNNFLGGYCNGISLASVSNRNKMIGLNINVTGGTISDTSAGNLILDCYNSADATPIGNKTAQGRVNNVVAGGATMTINAAAGSYHVGTATGATMTVAAPTNPTDGQQIDVCIHNGSGGALVVTWDTKLKAAGWVNPGIGTNRTVSFRYDSNYTFWYSIGMSSSDQQNV